MVPPSPLSATSSGLMPLKTSVTNSLKRYLKDTRGGKMESGSGLDRMFANQDIAPTSLHHRWVAPRSLVHGSVGNHSLPGVALPSLTSCVSSPQAGHHRWTKLYRTTSRAGYGFRSNHCRPSPVECLGSRAIGIERDGRCDFLQTFIFIMFQN